MNNIMGFLRTLFDFSFKTFITPGIVKILYALAIFIAGVIALILLIDGIEMLHYSSLGLVIILFSPVVFILSVIFERVILEFIILHFKIEEYVTKIEEHLAKRENKE